MNPPANPWNKSKPKNKHHNGPNLRKPPTPAETKFQEAHKKLQEAVQKHVKDYDSSSDEGDAVETNSVICTSVLKQKQVY